MPQDHGLIRRDRGPHTGEQAERQAPESIERTAPGSLGQRPCQPGDQTERPEGQQFPWGLDAQARSSFATWLVRTSAASPITDAKVHSAKPSPSTRRPAEINP